MTGDRWPGSWCDIHRDHIADNLRRALDLVPAGRRFCAVLKADAYGHGIATVVPLMRAQGVGCIGVTSNPEARAVRQAGFDGTLIRLRAATPDEVDDAAETGIEEQVGSPDAARHLAARARAGRPVRAHLALNAMGMSRDGLEIETDAGRQACREILKRLHGHIVGICTHYPCNAPRTLRPAAELFQRHAAWALDQGGLRRDRVTVHAGSSLTLVSDVAVDTDMYRCGAILYGILKPEWGFRATMALRARVVSIGEYPAGSTVGYDRACRLTRPSRLACLSVGYANGVRRVSANTGVVRIGDGLAPIMGKISMNTVVVDVTGLPGIGVGAVATLYDDDPDVGPAQAERQYQTIIADLCAEWGARNPRVVTG